MGPAFVQKQRDRFLGHPRPDLRKAGLSASDWLIADAWLTGKSLAAIGQSVGLRMPALSIRLKLLGLPRGDLRHQFKHCFFDRGKPFTGRSVAHLRDIGGLTNLEFGKQVELSQLVVRNMTWSRNADRHIRPEWAKRIIEWREKSLRRLFGMPNPRGRHALYRRDSLLKTFFPDLHDRYALLLETLPAIRGYAQQNREAKANDFGEFICEQSRLEAARKTERRVFRSLLSWSPELAPLFEKNVDRLRSSEPPRLIALELLAQGHGITAEIVEAGLRDRTATILPPRLKLMLLPPAEATARNPPHRPAKKTPLYRKAMRLRGEGRSWGWIARKLDPDGYAQDHAAASDKLRLGVKYLERTSDLKP